MRTPFPMFRPDGLWIAIAAGLLLLVTMTSIRLSGQDAAATSATGRALQRAAPQATPATGRPADTTLAARSPTSAR